MGGPPERRTWVPLLAGVVWLAAVGWGMGIVWSYAVTPGRQGLPPDSWPPESGIHRIPGSATLVMLVHPRCPCTRSSIDELALIMARCPGLLTAHVLVFKPDGMQDDWATTDLWSSAAAIPGVQVIRDDRGFEAERFRSSTSGQVALYDAGGRLIFSGGITGARGHSGDNPGRDAVVSLLTRGTADRVETPVFGCSLLDPSTITEVTPSRAIR